MTSKRSYFAELESPIPGEMAGDLLAKIHYISQELEEFGFSSEERKQIRFTLKSADASLAQRISTKIAEIAKKMCESYRPTEMKVLVNRLRSAFPFKEDPYPVLEKKGELIRFGSGRYGLGPLITSMMGFFDREFFELSKEFQARPHHFPSLIGVDTLHACSYLRSFPHSLNFVSHLEEDIDRIQDFSSTADCKDGKLVCDAGNLSPVDNLLSPSVCFHYYQWLQDREFASDQSVTALGKCFRYESGNLKGLERLWDFSMREIIFVGAKDFVLGERERSVQLVSKLLDSWGLSYEIKSATDPFFVDSYGKQATLQSVFDLKFEIQATLPYKSSSLAVGSFNYHQDFFGRSFSISRSGSALHTGCVGFGLERLALAFLSQYGLERGSWPEALRKGVS